MTQDSEAVNEQRAVDARQFVVAQFNDVRGALAGMAIRPLDRATLNRLEAIWSKTFDAVIPKTESFPRISRQRRRFLDIDGYIADAIDQFIAAQRDGNFDRMARTLSNGYRLLANAHRELDNMERALL